MKNQILDSPAFGRLHRSTPSMSSASPHCVAGFGAADKAARQKIVNAMTVDVEDYFQVGAFSRTIERKDWDDLPHRVERNTQLTLDILGGAGVRATFFCLGWVAERYPALVRRIADEGHEVASHGLAHIPVFEQNEDDFRADVRYSKQLLEDLSGTVVNGYRAASFSITTKTPWAQEILCEEGYRYSSSIYPVVHDHYGDRSAPRFAYLPNTDRAFLELPITTTSLGGVNLPCGGGGYFRLYPYLVSRWALKRVNQLDGQPSIFFIHPWELDPEQPRISGAPFKSRFRHYLNLRRMRGRLERLLDDFSWDRLDNVFLAERADA